MDKSNCFASFAACLNSTTSADSANTSCLSDFMGCGGGSDPSDGGIGGIGGPPIGPPPPVPHVPPIKPPHIPKPPYKPVPKEMLASLFTGKLSNDATSFITNCKNYLKANPNATSMSTELEAQFNDLQSKISSAVS